MGIPILASIVIGLVLIVVGILLVLFIKDINPPALQFIRILVALGAAFVAAGFLGYVTLEGNLENISIKAGGPFVIFVIIYFWNPPKIVQNIRGRRNGQGHA